MERLTRQWGKNPAVPIKLDYGELLDIPKKDYDAIVEMIQNLNGLERTCATSDTECKSPEELAADLARLAEYDRQIQSGELVRVVRCKECKFLDVEKGYPYSCPIGAELHPNGYCSQGERKE